MTSQNRNHACTFTVKDPRRNRRSLTRSLFLILCLCAWPATFAQWTRQPNATLKFPADAAVVSGQAILTNLLPGIDFNHPVAVRSMPGNSKSLFIVEREGLIKVIDDLDHPAPRVFLDIRDRVFASSWDVNDPEGFRAEGLTSFDFHPDFQNNGRFFVTYCTRTQSSQGDGNHNRISEFRASDDRQTGLPDSEIPFITQYDEGLGHNINDAHFGPDGYLYISIGDEGDGGTGDDYNNAQKIDKDFFSAILRIDVDKRAGNLPPNPHPANSQNYAVPSDNPFVGAESFLGKPVDKFKVHDEFWAVGLRNPWRFSFDPLTGRIYEGDVGQHGREEINRIDKGGNYGWSFKEGTINGPKGPAPTGLNFIDPVFEYSTGFGPLEGMCVTGGVVYRGSRIPGLYGSLIFADYASGNVWAMNVDQNPVTTPVQLFVKTGIAAFGYDPRNGDVILVNHDEGKLYTLAVSQATSASYPEKLSETGIFSNLSSLTPNAGILPYEVNLSFWSDGALKRRWFSLPDPRMTMQFAATQNWTFPEGGVWIKHFDLPMRSNDPSSAKRVETRVLVKTRGGTYGLSYKWDDAGQDAILVPEMGDTKTYTITDGTGTHQQTWRFPSRSDCLQCHTPGGGFVLGFNTPQLNRQITVGGITTNQIGALAAAGYFSNPPPHFAGLAALAVPDDENISRTWRVRSWLAANCSQCHQPGGSAHAQWDARLFTPLSGANIINGGLYNNTSGDPSNKVVVAGSLDHSLMFHRISVNDRDRMPPIGSTVLDQQAIKLLGDWITQDLPSYESFDVWKDRIFANNSGTDSTRDGDPDDDGASNYAEYLIGTDPLSGSSKLPVVISLRGSQLQFTFVQRRDRAIVVETARDSFVPVWEMLGTPENSLTFPAKNAPRAILDATSDSSRLYRFRVIEP